MKAQGRPDLSVSNCTSKEEYFIRCDKSETEKLFGVAFNRLMVAMKEKNTDIERLDEMRRDKRGREAKEPEKSRSKILKRPRGASGHRSFFWSTTTKRYTYFSS
jgi:hypothetical protein